MGLLLNKFLVGWVVFINIDVILSFSGYYCLGNMLVDILFWDFCVV